MLLICLKVYIALQATWACVEAGNEASELPWFVTIPRLVIGLAGFVMVLFL